MKTEIKIDGSRIVEIVEICKDGTEVRVCLISENMAEVFCKLFTKENEETRLTINYGGF
jgi:hypothetical protein